MGKSSPSISHLLRQGAYSGLVLKQDETIRKEFIKHLVDYGCQQDILKEPFAPQDYRIVFAIVIGKKQKKDIPFFSKVSLRDVLENILELMGYQCNFTYIVKP
jgi:uncharacterized protein (TIGR04141 family)